jgi:ferredoxin--NADP+ reductase
VIVRVNDRGERIPLTISDHDPVEGTINLVVQAVGATTSRFATLRAGDHLADVLGPLGAPTEVEDFGTCVVIGGGVGAAIALPVARALREGGNTVHAVIGGRTSDLVILADEMGASSDSLTITTDDGSAGLHGFVTDALAALIDEHDVAYVFCVGPIPMMEAVARLTEPLGIHTVASLNPIMVDGTGMCGGCRVKVSGETKFACVDGPEFDAHGVDFALLRARNAAYRDFEECNMAELEASDA